MHSMGEKMKQLGIDKLGIEDRLAVLDEISDSVAQDSAAMPVPTWHESELRRRVAAFDADRGQGRPFEEIIADIRRGR